MDKVTKAANRIGCIRARIDWFASDAISELRAVVPGATDRQLEYILPAIARFEQVLKVNGSVSE